MKNDVTEKNRIFYENHVAPMIRGRFSEMLKEHGLITRINPYLEADVNTVLGG